MHDVIGRHWSHACTSPACACEACSCCTRLTLEHAVLHTACCVLGRWLNCCVAAVIRQCGSCLPTSCQCAYKWCAVLAGVLLCACTPAARQALAKDFTKSTELGVSLTTASSNGSTASRCNTTLERPLGKKYRALVSGVMPQIEVVSSAHNILFI